jgi:hypothetical protein
MEEILNEVYLFIVCANNSGSTLLNRVLATSKNIVDLEYEGQEYIDVTGLNVMPLPWNLDCRRVWTERTEIFEDKSNYNWEIIRYIWTSYWKNNPKYHTANPRILLEKSPPNVVRTKILEEEFENSYFIVMVRNPYAIAEGIRRHMEYPLERGIKHWIRVTEKQIENIERLNRVIYFRYEDLCDYPDQMKRKMLDFLPALEDIKMDMEIFHRGKGLHNFNEEQIKRLSRKDVDLINSHLEKHTDILDYFDYSIVTKEVQQV